MKKQINYKLLNILLILGIILLLYLMKDLWIGVASKILNILLPFIIAFCVAYVFYPFLKYLVSKKIPKPIAILIIVLIVLSVVGLILYFVVPIFVEQLVNLLSNLGKISTDLATKYNIDMHAVNKTISKYSGKLLTNVTKYISDGSFIGIISNSINVLSKTIIIFIVSIYFLADMKNIRKRIKNYLSTKKEKSYQLIVKLDSEIYSYLKGLGLFMIIQFFEYTILFAIIGHPNFLLIGTMACVMTIIPYFGGIITNVTALLIASVVSPKLFIMSLIITLVFPNIDGYVISPKIYGKTNQLPPLLTIFSVTAGGALFGFKGIIIAVPLTIIIMSIIRTYKNEISKKITNIKEKI